MMKRMCSYVAAVGLLLVSMTASSALAQERRAAVLDFDGRGGNIARRAVVAGLRGRVELVPRSEVASTASDLGADLDSPTGVSEVASELGLDMVVKGEVRGRGRRLQTIIRVLDSSGNEVARRDTGSPAGRRGRRAVARAARDALEQAEGTLTTAPPPEEEVEEAPPPMPVEPLPEEPLEEEEPPDDEPAAVEGAPPFLRVLAGLGARTRDADILTVAGDTRRYDADPYPELVLRAELRPFTGSEDALQGILVEALFGYGFGLSSVDTATNTEFGTTVWRLFVGGAYALTLDIVELRGGLGFGYEVFDLENNDILASSAYSFLRPGLGVRVKVLGPLLSVGADAGFRLLLGAGDLTPRYGQSASGTGFDLSLVGEGALEMGLAYGARFSYVTYSLGFEGEATNPAETAQADGSTDAGFIATVYGGWQF